MLTFSRLGQHGRLGNQCFQIASMIGLSKKSNNPLALPKWQYAPFFNYDIPVMPQKKFVKYSEPHFHYTDVELKGDVDCIGYFQSEKYWSHCKDEVLKHLSFKEEYKDKVKEKYAHILSKQTIAISIRRGDYVNNPNYYLLPIEYYITALLSFFPMWKAYNLVIFSDDSEYCKIHFGFLDNAYIIESKNPGQYFGVNENAIEQLCLMSLCDNFILSNSTFSWWGAYLANAKMVVRPEHYAAGKLKQEIDFKDHYPYNWIKHNHEGVKIWLRDVTFTVPVHFDHPDRMANLNLNVCYLLNTFDTNIIIGEQGSDKFGYMKAWCRYEKFEDKEFHRTRMLNVMAKMAQTNIIVNHDADVFIPPLQLLESVNMIRYEGSDMVYPYDGRFARIPRKYFKQIEQFMDVGYLYKERWLGTNPTDLMSVGGCILFDRERFFDGGGENEKFISYGPEDVERFERFTKLDFKVDRMKGCLYHIDHFRGTNSVSQNRFFKANEKEYENVHKMTKQELINYVKTELCH